MGEPSNESSKKPTVAISMKAKHYALAKMFEQFPDALAFYNKTWETKKAQLKATVGFAPKLS